MLPRATCRHALPSLARAYIPRSFCKVARHTSMILSAVTLRTLCCSFSSSVMRSCGTLYTASKQQALARIVSGGKVDFFFFFSPQPKLLMLLRHHHPHRPWHPESKISQPTTPCPCRETSSASTTLAGRWCMPLGPGCSCRSYRTWNRRERSSLGGPPIES